MARAQLRTGTDGVARLWWICPGCRTSPAGWMHAVPVTGPQAWTWNGSLEKPTLNPSVKCTTGEKLDRICHTNLVDGVLLFHADCTHDLRGHHELPEFDDRADPCA